MGVNVSETIGISDKYILEILKTGDERSFRVVFDTYYSYLCMIGYGYVKDKYIVETIVGDVLYNIWQLRKDLEIKTTLKSYLTRSVKNRCINYIQQEYVQREMSMNVFEDKAAIEELFFVDSEHPLEKLLEEELAKKINAIIEELPTECKQVFTLSRFENLKYDEIAEKLNISVNTVKYHIKNALLKLRVELKEYLVTIIILLMTIL